MHFFSLFRLGEQILSKFGLALVYVEVINNHFRRRKSFYQKGKSKKQIKKKIKALRSLFFFYFPAVIGAGLLYLIVPYGSHGLLGVSHMKSTAPLVGFVVELLTSLVVMLTMLTCTDGGERALDTSASLVIGAAVTACHLFAVSHIMIQCTASITNRFRYTA